MFELFNPASWKPAILQAQPDDFWILSLLGFGIACATGYGIFHFIRRARIIEDTPTSKVRSAHQGYVELIGRCAYYENQPLLAPLTGTQCAWYSYEIAKRVRSGKHTRWKTLEKHFSDDLLLLIDDTGQCLINPAGAEVMPAANQVWYGHARHPLREVKPAGFLGLQIGSGNYRYTERRLHDGDPLYALGMFTTLDGNLSIAAETREVLKRWKNKQDAMLKHFDKNSDGRIDAGEWEQVREAAEQLVVRKQLQNADDTTQHMLGKTGQRARPYILSVQPQHKMSRNFRLKAFACLVAFVVTGPVSVWAIAVRLGL